MKHKLLSLGAALLLAASLIGCGANSQPSADYISMETAQKTALSNAKVSAADADISSTTLVDVAGITCYRVVFAANGNDYTCSIHAETGEIIEADYRAQSSTEAVTPSSPADDSAASTGTPTPSGSAETPPAATGTPAPSAPAENSPANTGTATAQIDEVRAKEIALNHAGVSAADATFIKSVLDYENGRQVYEIEWYANGAKYEYDIAVANGAVVSSEYEAAKIVDSSSLPPTSAAVTVEQAKQTALDHAGVKVADAVIYKAERDYEDGRLVYEIEFYVTSGSTVTEYDYEIDANTGTVVSYDYDIEGYAPAASGTAVSAETAKQTALARVPGATAANLYEWESDYDDGRLEYEGKIVYDGMEYEFTIDAATGNITEWEVERWGW